MLNELSWQTNVDNSIEIKILGVKQIFEIHKDININFF